MFRPSPDHSWKSASILLTPSFYFYRNRNRGAIHRSTFRETGEMARRPTGQPTESELELLRILWDRGPTTLGPLHAAVQRERPVAMTTVATTLKTMQAKGLVARDDSAPGSGIVWSAAVSRDSTARGLVGRLLDRLFDGSARRLVAHLIESGHLSDADRADLRRLLDDADDSGSRRP
jgi:predicted transcriptional regulator